MDFDGILLIIFKIITKVGWPTKDECEAGGSRFCESVLGLFVVLKQDFPGTEANESMMIGSILIIHVLFILYVPQFRPDNFIYNKVHLTKF